MCVGCFFELVGSVSVSVSAYVDVFMDIRTGQVNNNKNNMHTQVQNSSIKLRINPKVSKQSDATCPTENVQLLYYHYYYLFFSERFRAMLKSFSLAFVVATLFSASSSIDRSKKFEKIFEKMFFF